MGNILEEVKIDGSILEGGGQILRVSTALSAVTSKPLKIFNVRVKRSPPGLRMQHITAIKAVAAVSDAWVEGLKVGSKEVSFIPKTVKGGSFTFDVGTAGSTTLVLQALAPVTAYAPKQVFVEIRGGTNNQWAPPVEYVQHVLLPTVERMGFEGSVQLIRRGFYPKGGGILRAYFNPVKSLKPLDLTMKVKKVLNVWGLAYSCRLPDHITQRMVKSAETTLRKAGYEANIKIESLQANHPLCSPNPGCGIIIFADLDEGLRIAADSLGELGKPAEKVGEEAAVGLIQQLESGAPVDFHLADQLIVWMSLAEGVSKFCTSKLTLHTLTSIEVCKQFLGSKFTVEGEMGKPATVICEGIGLKNRFL
ncbi:RNA 3'-phosphate cyclase [Candidatus Bathyarchaeota archaeon]|nr:MAG: RNA 3'-phosphate cyclase [Candidatus Bathyarchaeota archaeon]